MVSERSGIEMIEEILQRLDIIEKRLGILDVTMKGFINSVNGVKVGATVGVKAAVVSGPGKEKEQPPIQPQDGFKNFTFVPSDASKMKPKLNPEALPLPQVKPKLVPVFGKMVAMINGKQTALHSLTVKVFDDKDVLVKESKTNRAGGWTAFLPPGRYVALFEGEFGGKKLVPQNRNFVVPEQLPEGQKNIEVG